MSLTRILGNISEARAYQWQLDNNNSLGVKMTQQDVQDLKMKVFKFESEANRNLRDEQVLRGLDIWKQNQ